MFKSGKWSKNNKCSCGVSITPGTTYCSQCFSQRMRDRQLGSNNFMKRVDVKLKQGASRKARCCPVPSRKGVKWSTEERLAIGERNRAITIHTHHLDQDETNNAITNKFRLPKGIHASIHQQAYKYIYERGLLSDYFTWLEPYLDMDLNQELEKQKSGI